ncbi:MAG: nitroreductase family protein [Roseburia hominis]
MAKTRYSVRSYKDKRVEKEKLEQILEACTCSSNSSKFTTCKIIGSSGKRRVR